MKRNDIINSLIAIKKYKSYLEIGIGDGANYNQIICENKNNVDPCFDSLDSQNISHVKNVMTSDEFFNKNTEMFDVIFVDGLHEYQQVYRDIKNSLNVLNEKWLYCLS
jgi:predicted O-methyltransferase YrrM